MSKIILKKYGSGNTVLVAFPGWTHPIENEKEFLNLLSKKYTVYSVCLPGYVKNKNSNKFNDFKNLVSDIDKEIKKIKSKNIVYIGFSMGCRLIMELENKYPNKYKKIFVGTPVHNYRIPLWANLLLLNSNIINILRKSKSFKLFIVNKALKNILNDNKAVFNKNRNVTLTGAFDSLIGLIKSDNTFIKYKKTTNFIYGNNDKYLYEAKKYNLKSLYIIENADHNCVRNHEEEVVRIIDRLVN
ncbi:MAG: alpha/beta hydrolase [Pseudomonadales bacterium]|nr:alpha/beta hydrolase [Pseudomonadales bacterium]